MRPFSLLVKPASADCNLRCRYCFYLDRASLYPETSIHRMSGTVQERLIRSFLATDQPQHGFGWQGGEPTLMGVDFFRRTVALQEQYGHHGAVVSNGLQTNGTLLDDAFATLLARYRFLVGVSVDGPAALHDINRPRVDNSGTHAAVMRGIACLKRHGVDYNILTLVNAANAEFPREIYHYLRDMDVFFHQYIECVEFDEQGNLAPYSVTADRWGAFLCGIYDEWMKGDTHRVSVRLFDSILTKLVDGVANVCHMGHDCRNYLVVEHNGDVYPCDFFVQPELRLGNIMENSWEEMLASPLYAAFGQRKSQWNMACETCRYLNVCGGCCPKNRAGGGRDPHGLSVLCAGWKRFFDHAMPGLEKLAETIQADRAAAQRFRELELNRARQAVGSTATVRMGRNAPCPCGSGRKYKKCCGASG